MTCLALSDDESLFISGWLRGGLLITLSCMYIIFFLFIKLEIEVMGMVALKGYFASLFQIPRARKSFLMYFFPKR